MNKKTPIQEAVDKLKYRIGLHPFSDLRGGMQEAVRILEAQLPTERKFMGDVWEEAVKTIKRETSIEFIDWDKAIINYSESDIGRDKTTFFLQFEPDKTKE